jgi:nucleotidyltransferase AbiEii toxin of type IV toxin-antitoxin system
MLDAYSLEVALGELSRVLASRRLAYELVTVGGSSLLLLGLVQRPTRDLDVVALVEAGKYVRARELPTPLREAVRQVGETLGIGPNWINVGPQSLLDFGLPEGFAERAEIRRYGPLVLHVASRQDQLALKLYAAADQGPQSKHVQDLMALAPTADELTRAARWAITHDPSQPFRSELVAALRLLGVPDADSLV